MILYETGKSPKISVNKNQITYLSLKFTLRRVTFTNIRVNVTDESMQLKKKMSIWH